MSTIVELVAENVKRLKAVTIRPASNVICVGGRNGAGKSSILDSIGYALGGKDDLPARPIRAGESAARIVLKTEDITVTRTFTPAGSYLTVSSKYGARYPSPQAMLDKLVGPQIDPMAFSRLSPSEQATQLRRLLGIDTAALDAERADVFEKRRIVNGEAKSLSGALSQMPEFPDAPADQVSIADLTLELERRNAVNAEIARQRAEAERLAAEAVATQDRLADLQAQIGALEKKLQEMRTRAEAEAAKLKSSRESAAAAAESVAALVPADTSEIAALLKSAELQNAKVRANAERAAMANRLRAKVEESERLTAQLDDIDARKRAMLSSATMPLDGLGMDDSGVTFNGVPLPQASSAEKIRVGVALALAMNRGLRVLRIYDGSLLDDENLDLIRGMADGAGAQIWIERVGDGREISVVVEDGEVKSIRAEPAQCNDTALTSTRP